MGLSQLATWGRAQLLHDRVRVSPGPPSELLRPDVNVVHVRRCCPVHPRHVARQVQELGPGFRAQVTVRDTRAPEPAVAQLTAGLTVEEVREWLQDDIQELVGRVFGEQLGYPAVRAKLEVLGVTPCPRFHADHVGVRALVTYSGPGTLYVPNSHAKRRWIWGGGGGVAVAAADEAAAIQAGEGHMLFLKGHAAPGMYGMGAVHRSPDVVPGGPLRLLLTVDDVVREDACGCGREHGGDEAGSGMNGLDGEGEGDHRPDATLAAGKRESVGVAR